MSQEDVTDQVQPSVSQTDDQPSISQDDLDDNSSGRPANKRFKTHPKHEIFLDKLPSCEAYEKSYMHRDVITHVQVTKTQFLITASLDGSLKFWKKTTDGIEFVKDFRMQKGPVDDMSVTSSGSELATISKRDKSVKIFDVVNFDMINMLSLEFEPQCLEWTNSASIGSENLVISDSLSAHIYTFNARQTDNQPKRTLTDVHSAVVCRMRYNPVYQIVVSADVDGIIEYWHTAERNYELAKRPEVKFDSKLDTDLFEFVVEEDKDQSEQKLRLHNINFSPDGEFFATTSSDRKIRIFQFRRGKVLRRYDESLERLVELHKNNPIMNNMDFARRMAIEREITKQALHRHENAILDQSGHFIMFPTMLGVKVWNWRTNELVRSFGKDETNFRPLCISLFQGLVLSSIVRKFNIDSLEASVEDPTLYSTAHRKNRFYCFSRRIFEDNQDRDIFNEKPTREEVLAAIELEEATKQPTVFENATIHTTMGDIHLKLYVKLTPKTCENFCVHAKNNYYNNHVFHRVIKQFMIQTGDPAGTGTGGESIWGDEFEDEFSEQLKHDKPYTLSMANCGPNTNGSQFFITVAPCPFLDNKHTVFGRVSRGMDICLAISKVKTDPKTDKPLQDVRILNIKVF